MKNDSKYFPVLTMLFAAILGAFVLFRPAPARAIPVIDAGVISTTAGNWMLSIADKIYRVAKDLWNDYSGIIVAAMKVAALMIVQMITQKIMGDGKSSPSVVQDYNSYLYTSPQQRAMSQMNSFFTTTSRGRASALNYEGVGPNYDSYMIKEAKLGISGQAFNTNIQNQTTDPRLMFGDGNMKGITSYMQCANNVMCYTLTATAKYNEEVNKAQTIAKSETVNGFLPVKKNGRIARPAMAAQLALSTVDKMGTDMIMSTTPKDGFLPAVTTIGKGMAIAILAKASNFYIADDAGKQAARNAANKMDTFPFSLSYSDKDGVGIKNKQGGIEYGGGLGAGAVTALKKQGKELLNMNGTTRTPAAAAATPAPAPVNP